jgi:hypothetical protein
VDLIIATDGSVLFGVGYHGWVLATKDEKIIRRGGAPYDGIQSLMTSYRWELGGLVTGLAVLLFCAGTINIRSVLFLCNNESAVTVARRPTSNSIFHNTKCDWDLIVTIQDLIVRWCKGISFIFHWLKVHVDLIDWPPIRGERLNMEVNLQANVVRAQARVSIVARPNCTHWDIEEASLSIIGIKVTSYMKTKLTSHMHDDDLHTFIFTKETWYPHTFDSIDWHAN